jgi:phospholipid/cholesterol/gamma-HCH transport system substrate-binding protein
MSEASLKIKVGLLVVIALGISVAFGIALGAFDWGEKKAFAVEFSDSGAVRPGAQVRIAGMKAGRVATVDFLGPGASKLGRDVHVRLGIEVDIAMASSIRSDAEFHITTRGVLGEKYVEIVPGTPTAQELKAAAVIRGFDPPRIDLFLSKLDRILGQIVNLLGGKSGDLRGFMDNLISLSKRADTFIAAHQEKVGTLLSNLSEMSGDLRVVLGNLKKGMPTGQLLTDTITRIESIGGLIEKELPATTLSARQALTDVRVAAVSLNTLADEVLKHRVVLDQVLERIPTIVRWTEDAVRDTAAIAHRTAQGEGTIGLLLRDAEVYDQVKALLRELKQRPWRILWRD